MKLSHKVSPFSNPAATLAMAMVAGLGVVFMILALGIGVSQGSAADGAAIGFLFAVGLALFILGLVAWLGLAQPQKHFDDINLPADDDHHGHEAHDEHTHDEHAQPEKSGH